MKLWLLDADVIINMMGLGIFDQLTKQHEVYVASTVVDEVTYYREGDLKRGRIIHVDFRAQYIAPGKVEELSVTVDEITTIFKNVPDSIKMGIHDGEIESLAVLYQNESLMFCTCDAAAIRTLPFLNLSDRGISAEKLLHSSGLTKANLPETFTESYFQSNLSIGKERKIYGQ